MKSSTLQSARARSRRIGARVKRLPNSTEIKQSIGAVLRKARSAKAWTQEDVADRVGVTSEFYARVERGHTMPGLTTLVKLANVFRLDVDVLLGFEEVGALNLRVDQEPRRFRKLARRLRRTRPKHLRLLDKVMSAMEQAQSADRERS